MKTPLPLPLAVVLSAMSGLLLILAFPYTQLVGLSLVALVPLELALQGQGPWRGAVLGFLGMLVFHCYLMFWANFFGPPAFLALAVERNLVWALFGFCMGLFPTGRPHARALAFASLWVVCEYLRIFGPFGCTWGTLSAILSRYPVWIQVDSLFGPWTLSFVLAYGNAAVAQFLLKRRGPLLVALVLLVGSLLFGAYRLSHVPPTTRFVHFGVIQPNMGRDVRWDPRFAENALARLEESTLKVSQMGSQVVVWPETSIPYRDFSKSPTLTFRFGMLARTTGNYLLAGSIEMVHDAGNHTLNAVSLISPDGAFVARYDKQRLVPGGEFLPFESWLRSYRIFDRVMRYIPGIEPGVVTANLRDQQLKMGLLICFESMVPTLALERYRAGAQVLIVPTNDGWFGLNSAIRHHFEMAPMRAVETGLPVVQSGNTGISGFVDGFGRILEETTPNEYDWRQAALPLTPITTLYSQVGDILPCVLALVWIFLLIRGRSNISLTEARSPEGS